MPEDRETTPTTPRPRPNSPKKELAWWQKALVAAIFIVVCFVGFAIVGFLTTNPSTNGNPQTLAKTPAVTANDQAPAWFSKFSDEVGKKFADIDAKLATAQATPAVIPPDALQVPPLSEVRVPPAHSLATPTRQRYAGSPDPVVQNGIKYTGNSCKRNDGAIGREGYNTYGTLGCWKQ